MTIRIASSDDASQILAVYAPYIENTAVSFEYSVPSVKEFAERIRTILDKHPYLVAEEDNKIIGYAYASVYHGRIAYSHSVEVSVYVAQEYHLKGTGYALYCALEKLLKIQNVTNLYACIAATDDENDPYLTDGSIRFHERCGYKPVGRPSNCGCKFGRWYSTLWMEKIIQQVDPSEEFVPFSTIKNKGDIDYD